MNRIYKLPMGKTVVGMTSHIEKFLADRQGMTCQLTISKEGERTIQAVAKGIKKNLLLSWLIIQLTEEGTEKVNIRTAAFTPLGFGFHVLPIVFIPKPLLISAVAETVKAVKLARLDKLLDSAIRDYLTSLPAGEQKEAGVVN